MFLNLGPIMPIYEYRCAACGFQKEYLQKMGAALLTDCPECGTASLRKMVTAAGFQLKGSGWYATDFKNGSQTKSPSQGKPVAKTDDKSDDKSAAKSEDKPAAKSEDKPAAKSDAKPAPEAAAKKPDAAAAPAASGAGASPA
jgi:putative FmdB family regulatory protein